jgi:membrane protein YdbS with pleckstrin-like domain
MVSSNVASPGALIFKPEPSNGGTHMAVLTATTSVLLLAPLVAGLILLRDYWYVFLALIIGALAVSWFLLRYALYFPHMQYEVAEDGLHLRYGPLLHYHIPYAGIKRVWPHNFEQRPYARAVSSPGLCLYAARYYHIGKVKMCATAYKGAILLIKTDGETYGINPADREGFLDALKSRTMI